MKGCLLFFLGLSFSVTSFAVDFSECVGNIQKEASRNFGNEVEFYSFAAENVQLDGSLTMSPLTAKGDKIIVLEDGKYARTPVDFSCHPLTGEVSYEVLETRIINGGAWLRGLTMTVHTVFHQNVEAITQKIKAEWRSMDKYSFVTLSFSASDHTYPSWEFSYKRRKSFLNFKAYEEIAHMDDKFNGTSSTQLYFYPVRR